MRKYFRTVNSLERAFVGLLAAIIGSLITLWVPDPAAIGLLIVLLPLGIFSLSYICVYGLWPITTAFSKKIAKIYHQYLASRSKDLTEAKPEELISLPSSESATFFAQRFAQAFPGVRDITWYERREAIRRLETLLRDPLVFKGESGFTTPIWRWRGGNLQIPSFRALSGGTVLIDTLELKVTKVAAVPSPDDYRCFVYLEAAPMKPCGVYNSNDDVIQNMIHNFGCAWEEYGLYKNKYFISREEYDDNAAVVRGKLVTLGDDVKLRRRFLAPYNLVIAPHHSVINNFHFDAELEEVMNMMLRGQASVETLQEMVRVLPNRRRG